MVECNKYSQHYSTLYCTYNKPKFVMLKKKKGKYQTTTAQTVTENLARPVEKQRGWSFHDLLLFLCHSPLCISRKKPTQFPFLYETDAYNLRPSQPCHISLLTLAKWRPSPFQGTLFPWIYSHSERQSSSLEYGFLYKAMHTVKWL